MRAMVMDIERFRRRRGTSTIPFLIPTKDGYSHKHQGMKTSMNALLIVISEPGKSREAVDGIAAAICPYLGTFGEQASIDSTERLRELCNGDEGPTATLLRVSLAGTARVDFSTMVGKLTRFLRRTIKDAELEVHFDLYRIEERGKA